MGSKIDHVYRTLMNDKFFNKGWGSAKCLKRLFEFRKIISNRETCQRLVAKDFPIKIHKEEVHSDCHILEGHFTSPLVKHLPGLLPPEAETAYFQLLLPNEWPGHLRPVCIQLAGTGDHQFWRRRALIAKPLLKEAGIASLLLENPFYGVRKPKEQVRSSLCNVSDIFVMGASLVLECIALLRWCESRGYGPLGLTGISMGGHMASLAATNWNQPIVLVPCLSWSTASGVFTKGVMSGSINWDLLEQQFSDDVIYRNEIWNMLDFREDDAFRAGQEFAQRYPESMKHVQSLKHKEVKDNKTQPTPVSYTSPIVYSTAVSYNGMSSVSSHQSNVAFTPPTNLIEPSKQKPKSSFQMHLDAIKSATIATKSIVISGAKYLNPKLSILNEVQSINLLSTLSKATSVFGNHLLSTSRRKTLCQEESLQFMRGIMDECTHLRNFSMPVDTDLIIIVQAKDDGYIPRDGVMDLRELWPQAEVRYVDAGHITAFLLYQKVFRQSIIDGFDRLIKKYHH